MAAKLRPDLALVAACCRWPDDEARRQAIRNTAAQVTDWKACIGLAAAHRVSGFVAQGLEAAGVRLPENVSALLAERRQAIRTAGLVQLRETLRLSVALRNGSVEHRVLKGIPLAMLAYGTPTLKQSWDIDLLVQPEQAVAAGAILRELGFRAIPPARDLDQAELTRWAVASKDIMLQSDEGVVVELHWRLSDHPQLLRGMGTTCRGREVALIGDWSVPTLADADNLAYLAVHGAFHGWSRLKWLGDYAAFLQSFEPEPREALIASARARGPERAIDQANVLVDRFFHLTVAAGSDEVVRHLADLGDHILTARTPDQEIEADREAQRKIRRCQWLLIPGAQYRALLAIGWFRGSEDRKRIPLPAGLHWLYWLLRPFTGVSRLASRRLGNRELRRNGRI
ncbi:MAG TPA: nucleotidyltransferase family protein [Sphingomicrobium sp.]|jgi:hypothetical protein